MSSTFSAGFTGSRKRSLQARERANGTHDMEIGKAALEWPPARGNDVAGRNGASGSEAGTATSKSHPSFHCLSSSLHAYNKDQNTETETERQWTVEGDGVTTSDTMMDMVFCYGVSLQDGGRRDGGEAHAKQGRREATHDEQSSSSGTQQVAEMVDP